MHRYGTHTIAESAGKAPVTISDPGAGHDGVTMTDRYEMVVCQSGNLELRDPDDPDCWITTDSPATVTR